MATLSSPVNNTARLRTLIEFSMPSRVVASQSLYHNPDIKRMYPAYLLVLYGIMKASVPMLTMAARRSTELAPYDEVAALLAPYYQRHVEEERGHDIWVLEDLEAMGIARDHAISFIAPFPVAQLVGSQYYIIEHVHPCVHLGYMEIAEGYPPSVDLVNFLQERTGFPRSAFRSLERHAVIDEVHGNDLHELLNKLPLCREHKELIGLNALETIRTTGRVLDEVLSGRVKVPESFLGSPG